MQRQGNGRGMLWRGQLLFSACIGIVLADAAVSADDPGGDVLVTVNGTPITAAEARFEFYVKQLPDSASESQRRQLVEKLVDRLLIEQFLRRIKVEADAEEVERQYLLVKNLIEMRGGTFQEVLKTIGLSEAELRRTLALPVAWTQFVRQTVTDSQIREYFAQNRRLLDGTRLQGAQIVRPIAEGAGDSEWQKAEELLTQVRAAIVAGSITFAEAARQHSLSPSATQGGDLGEFEYRGRIAPELAEVAFALTPGEVSKVFRTRFGVHLLTVTGEKPGQLSAEDVRPQILEALGERLWEQQVQAERAQARIVWPSSSPY